MIAGNSAIVATGMGVRRGGRWLLRPVAFGMAEGVIGIAGPPGAGKSTLLATFATLRRPQAGVLEILGHDTGNSAGLRAVRGRIGYLPGRFCWAETMTAGEFIGYAAYYKGMRAADVDQALERLGLTESAGTELSLLPPDVRLRAGLAATCVHAPALVLLDEPLNGLGDAAAAETIPVLRSLAPTVVVTAGSAAELTPWCDRVLALEGGRLAELPPHGAGRPVPLPAAPDAAPGRRRPSVRPLAALLPRIVLGRMAAGSGAGV